MNASQAERHHQSQLLPQLLLSQSQSRLCQLLHLARPAFLACLAHQGSAVQAHPDHPVHPGKGLWLVLLMMRSEWLSLRTGIWWTRQLMKKWHELVQLEVA